MVNRYRLSQRVYLYYRKRDDKVACEHCGEKLRAGDEIVSKRHTRWRKATLYCEKCARELNIV